MLRRLAISAALALCPLLTACPESVHPISDPATAGHDPAVFGVWHGSFDGDEMYLHVGPGERGMTKAVQVEHKQKGDINTERYFAFPTRLGKLAMLNVHRVDEERHSAYTLFRYQADKKKLTLWILSYAAAREDIKAGKLKGKVEDGPFGETRITASSEELVKYLQEGDPKRLFDKPLVFRRIAQR